MLRYDFACFIADLHVPLSHVVEDPLDVFHVLKAFLWLLMLRYDFAGIIAELNVSMLSR